MKVVVLDASVAVKWFLSPKDERLTDEALALYREFLQQEDQFPRPGHLLGGGRERDSGRQFASRPVSKSAQHRKRSLLWRSANFPPFLSLHLLEQGVSDRHHV